MDLKSIGDKTPCRFKSGPGHFVLVVEFLSYWASGEMADALALGASGSNPVGVQISPRPLEVKILPRTCLHSAGPLEDILRAWFSGRMRPCQGRDGSSILPARIKNKKSPIRDFLF